MTRLRWWERQSIKRDGAVYPPLIVLTVTQTNPRKAMTVSQLQFRVEGIKNEDFKGFSLATPPRLRVPMTLDIPRGIMRKICACSIACDVTFV